MRQFFKFMFASMLGVFLSTILLIFLFFILIAGIVSSASTKQEVKIESNSILHIQFDYPIKDRTSKNPFENFNFFSFEPSNQPGLNDILKNLEKAAGDPDITGIYLNLTGLDAGLATVEEIRNALLKFKESGKFILAYADFYSQGTYYLATTADQIWVNPQGGVDFKGFASKIPFIKGTLEKLDIEPQVIRHGKFKSAIEPLILDKMSTENKEQVATYVNAFWMHFVDEIAFERKIDRDTLLAVANSFGIEQPEDALRYKLVDKIGYKDELIETLLEKSGKAKDDDLTLVSLKRYVKSPGPDKEFTREKIAIIYASGDIVDGKGDRDEIGSSELSETIRKARKDERVKAVVLRVNSPGGSALASEVIWREVSLCRKVKPVIVSMGDVAASGGYYISCAADKIVAQPNTVTGSIGVFGIIFNAENMFRNKLGVTFDSYQTSDFAEIGSMTRPLTEPERMIYQRSVERVYETFTNRVADGRKMDVAQVDSIGQGRVWAGTDALRLGLVDTLGGIDDAISIAADAAELTNYRIVELPEEEDALKQVLKEIQGDVYTSYLNFKFGESLSFLKTAEKLVKYQGIQARTFVEKIEF